MRVTDVIARVRAHRAAELVAGATRRAAVLVPLVPRDDGHVDLLFTRRSERLSSHAGQVSFPGGRRDEGDGSIEHTALRETHEELAIEPRAIEVVGRLEPMMTVTGFHVTPVVGVVSGDVEPVPNPAEVARVFRVPLLSLLDESRWEKRTHEYRGSSYEIWHFPYDGEDIWGATGYMVREFLELLRRGG